MAAIKVNKTCNNGIWDAVVTIGNEDSFLSAMTSSVHTPPAQWQSVHSYSVNSNTKKVFRYKQNGETDYSEEDFGFCTGVIGPQETAQVNSIENPVATVIDCEAEFIILPMFLESHGDIVQLPDPIMSIKANCMCEVTAIYFTQSGQFGTIIVDSQEHWDGTARILDNGFRHVQYQVNNPTQSGVELLKYKLQTTCGESIEGEINIKLIPSL